MFLVMKIFRNKWFWIIFAVVAVIAVGFLINSQGPEKPTQEYITETVKQTDLVQYVSATASIIADPDIDLKFQTPGKIEKINIKEGQTVTKNQVLAELESSSLQIQVNSAQAALDLAVANLNLQKAGAKDADIKVSELSVESQQVALNTSKQNLENTKILADQSIDTTKISLDTAQLSYEAAETAFNNAQTDLQNTANLNQQAVDDAYANAKTGINTQLVTVASAMTTADSVLGIENVETNDSFEDYLGVREQQSLINSKIYYENTKNLYNQTLEELNNLSENYNNYEVRLLIDKAQIAINNAILLIDETRSVLDKSVYFSALDTYRASVDTAKSNLTAGKTSLLTLEQAVDNALLTQTSNQDSAQSAVDAAKASLDNSRQNLNTAQNNYNSAIIEWDTKLADAQADVDAKQKAVESAKASLDLKSDGPRAVDLAPYEAQVRQAQATLDAAKNDLEKTKLKSPVDGLIAKVNTEVGENIDTVFVFANVNSKELVLEADIAEADIVKVNVNDPVDITLDAFGDDLIFGGKVASIDPTQTLIEGVTYYQIKIAFTDLDQSLDIKTGMTADVEIKTDERKNVLVVPQRAVLIKDEQKYIRILENNEITEVNVETGLSGSDGLVEIKKNIKPGQEVVTFIKELE